MAALLWAGVVFPLTGAECVIPGDPDMISFYTDFFYSGTGRDFLFHLNERLLSLEKPSGPLQASGLRARLLKISQWSRVVQRSFRRFSPTATGMADIDAANEQNLANARVLLDQMGLQLDIVSGRFRVRHEAIGGQSDYYKFAFINEAEIEQQLNKTRSFRVSIRESRVEIPWDFDFLSGVTGLDLNAEFFFDTLLENKRLSLLLATLYRMSPREIDYIAHLPGPEGVGGWRSIYRRPELAMGMYVLSGAMRVDDRGKLRLPGGAASAAVWKELAGCDPDSDPAGFLMNLALKDQGKLNYVYVFTSFLPPPLLEAIFQPGCRDKFRALYPHITLSASEILTDQQFPAFQEPGFFLLLYLLRVRGGQIIMEPSPDVWLRVLDIVAVAPGQGGEAGGADTGKNPENAGGWSHPLDFLRRLLIAANSSGGEGLLRKFAALLIKFQDRPALMNVASLSRLAQLYDNASIMADYLEKIPVQNPATVETVRRWLLLFKETAPEEDISLFTAISQALLEYISHMARYASKGSDFDPMIIDLTQIPLNRGEYYDRVFHFMETALGVREGRNDLLDPILETLPDPVVHIGGSAYRFPVKEMYREQLERILNSQDVGSPGQLLEINGLLRRLERETPAKLGLSFNLRLQELLGQLSYAEISDNAPGNVRRRVMSYSRETLYKIKVRLAALFNAEQPPTPDAVAQAAQSLKQNVLVFHLKNFLVAAAYALNAKNPELRLFLNPNVTRMHDFDYSDDKRGNPWHFSGAPEVGEDFSEYHFRGGLSRLNLLLAAKQQDHLLRRAFVYKHTYLQPLMVHWQSVYPAPAARHDILFRGALADFGFNVMEQGRRDPGLRERVIAAISSVAAGLNYRNAVLFISGLCPEPGLFSSEAAKLGEMFLQDSALLEQFPRRAELTAYISAPLNSIMAGEEAYTGKIFSRSFGSLTPRNISMFPQELARFFVSGWLSGESMDEYYIQTGRLMQRLKLHPVLLGVILYAYINSAFPNFYNQNHGNDYYSVHALFDFFNEARLNSIIQNLKKEGYLKLQ